MEGKYKYDGKYTGIDTLIRIDGYYQSNSFYGNLFMFFKNDEIAEEPVYKYGIPFDISAWGKYIVSNDTIEAQIVTDGGIKCYGDNWFSKKVIFKIIDNETLLYQKYDRNDTLVFVQSDYLMRPENLEEIKDENWLINHKYNWKDGYYPGDK